MNNKKEAIETIGLVCISSERERSLESGFHILQIEPKEQEIYLQIEPYGSQDLNLFKC